MRAVTSEQRDVGLNPIQSEELIVDSCICDTPSGNLIRRQETKRSEPVLDSHTNEVAAIAIDDVCEIFLVISFAISTYLTSVKRYKFAISSHTSMDPNKHR